MQIGNLTERGSAWDNPSINRVYDIMDYSPTLNTCGGGGRTPLVVVKERDEMIEVNGMASAVAAQDHLKKFSVKDEDGKYRIRRITPREAYRLMGFTDEEFDKAKGAGTSDTQLYRQAGNSIVVNVLADIMQNLYDAMPYLFDDLQVGSYFSGIGAFESALDRLDVK